MSHFVGQPAAINRFLGLLDNDDATNLPIGLAALARNCAFDLVSVRTRDGFNTTMTGVNKSPITGILGMIYTPEVSSESFFQLPVIFDFKGALQYEKPVGSGQMVIVPPGLFTPPANAHMIAVQTYNKGWLAFSNLNVPTSQMAVLDPKTLNLDPYGMKPFGWTWLPSTQVLVGEVATPTAPGGNGHTYRCTVAGSTAPFEPAWPLTENGTVVDGSATWEEYTAVIANRLPPPAQPALTRDPGAGTFAAGQDVYILLTFLNGMGESLASVTQKLVNTVANDAVQVAIPTLSAQPGYVRGLPSPYAITYVRVYEANVATGAAAPPETAYQLVNQYALGSTATVTAAASSGTYPPDLCTARITPGQLPTPDDEPVIQRISSGGTFAVGRDVYVLQTYANGSGETPAGPVNSIANTEANDGVQVTVAAPAEYPQIAHINLYEADVPTGNPAPPSTSFAFVGSYSPGATPTITTSAAGAPPPVVNSTGPAGNIVADTATGGINGTQGYRYAAIMFQNRNYSVSGFTQASVIQYIVDEDGWELGIFNAAPGPANIIARIVAFTVADGTNAGPFNWNGNINPQVPSQNFVYPQTTVVNQVAQSATIFYDNVTTSGTFNFTDEYLLADNSVTDRLDIIWPAPCVHIAFHPSINRMVQTGLYENMSGCRISLAGAPEDYYGDTCDVTVGSDDGQRAWGTLEYRDVVYLLRERGGLRLSASANDPNTWSARTAWDTVGPCGPRAFAATSKFIIFVHRSGIYKYDDTSPDLMTKEIPYWWGTINWLAATTVNVTIDHETHQVFVNVPVGNSMVPNQRVLLNYEEGWQNPIHYSTYSGKEISIDSCRKYSIDDLSAFVGARLERAIAEPPAYTYGDAGVVLTPSSFFVSQLVFGSAGPDGTVQAVTPGVFSDNGSGIDWQYETVCPQTTMALCRIEGFVGNIRGDGTLFPSFLAARDMVFGEDESGPIKSKELKCDPVNLSIFQPISITRKVEKRYNEKWRMRFTNGKVKGAWASIKFLQIYSIPMFAGREESEG